jgi:hypothetical protein
MKNSICLSVREFNALKSVVDYMYWEEKRDYEACEGSTFQKNHIFLSFKILSSLINRIEKGE